MARFEARVLAGGRVRVLQVSAASAAEARAAVSHHGRVISVRRCGWGLFELGLSRSERYILMIRLAAMVESKVGIAEALRQLGDTFRGRVRRTTERLVDAIEIGDDLPTAFERLPQAFPAAVVALVRAGCTGGSTPKALRDAAAFEQEIAEIEQQSSLALVTSIFNFFLAAVVMVGTSEYLEPMLKGTELFRTAGSAIDTGGMMVLAHVSTIVVIGLSLLLLVMIAVATIGRQIAPVACDRLISVFPFYRRIAQGRDTYVVLYKMSLLVRSGVAIDAVLSLTAESAPPGAMRRDLAAARVLVKAGRPWSEALRLLPAVDRASLMAAEDRDEIARTLNAMALQYKDLYIHGLSVLVPVLKSVSVVFLGIAALVLFGLTVLPMFQVTNFISTQ